MDEEKEQGQKIESANPAHKIMNRLKKNRESLHIARIPEKTKTAFLALADSDFCSDYGMTLKFLVDGIISQDTQLIIENLENHENRIVALEAIVVTNEKQEEKRGTKRMLDGTVRRVKRHD